MRNYNIFFPKYLGKAALGVSFVFLLGALYVSFGDKEHQKSQNPFNTSIVLDVSLSMNVWDGNSDEESRLKVVKQKITNIVSTLPHNFALTIFSGTPQRIIPLTSDNGLFLTFLSGVQRENVSEGGTDISLALEDTIRNFVDDASGNIILFTDGGDEDFSNISKIKKELKKRDIGLFIVGVGTEKGGYIPYARDVFGRVSYKKSKGRLITSSLNEKSLKKLANALGGTYMHISEIGNGEVFQIQKGGTIRKKTLFSTTWGGVFLGFLFWMYYVLHFFIRKNYLNRKLGKK